MEPVGPSRRVFRFGQFEADAAHNALTRGGVRVKIQEQPFRALVMILERAGEIVTREELRRQLWPDGIFVDFDGSLNVVLKRVRAALDDDPDNPRFIETVPRKGYRFIAPVKISEGGKSVEPVASEPRDGETVPSAGGGAAEADVYAHGWRGSRGRVAWISATVLGLAAVATWWIGSRREQPGTGAVHPGLTATIPLAVIPFSNSGAGLALDYLRYAIASDVVTDLTYVHSLSVRPAASTTQYGEHPVDAAAAGRELKVAYVISGDLAREHGKLSVMVKLTRVADDRVTWQDSVSAGANEPIQLHDGLTRRLLNGVVAVLGGEESLAEIPAPHSQRAYDFYLRSVAIPRDPGPNKVAITGLQASVAEDPNYAPAWKELAWRYYLEAQYAAGDEETYQKSEEASARAAALDPNGIVSWARIQVEHGELEAAYDVAKAQLTRRPDAAQAHFEMAYVYRYAGLLDGAARECEAAVALDPNPSFRSCAKVFMYRGDYERAMAFADLDGSSGWSVRQRMQFALRQKHEAEALSLATIAVEGGYSDSEIVQARLRNDEPGKLNAIAEKAEQWAASRSDPEDKYETAAMLAYAGQGDRAMRVLKAAIQGNYCAAPMLESDPLLATLRGLGDFMELRKQAGACQQAFEQHAGEAASQNSRMAH